MESATAADIEKLKDQLDELSKQVKQVSRRLAKEEVEQGEDFLEKNSRQLKESWQEMRQQAQDAGGKVHGYAKENPWQVAAATAALGFLAACLLPRDRR